MDIRDKLLQTIQPNDPQFEVLLNNAMQAEIAKLEEELRVKKNRNTRKKEELVTVLESRKNLKKSIEEKTKLAESMQRATHCLQDYSKYMLEKLELTKNRLDEDSLKRLHNIEEAEKLRDKYQKKWEEYEEQFEACSLAKERKIAKEELQKVEIQLGMVKMNIQVLEKKVRDYEKIKEIQLQKDIIQIAEMWIKHRSNVENVKKLRKEAAEYKMLIAEQKKKIEKLIKEKESEERQNALARFKMPPPPFMDKSLMETIMSQYSQPSPRPSPKVEPKLRLSQSYGSTYNNKELLDDFDSVSMLSSLSELSAENLNAANVQEIEEVRNDEDSVSLSSNQDIEFATESNQPNIMMRSGEMSPREIVRSPAKSVAGPSQISVRKTQIEKPVLEKSESSKRPANSPRESKIRKKPHEEHPKAIINPKEESPQRKSAVNLETVKNIQENLRKGRRPDTSEKFVPEERELSQSSTSVLPEVATSVLNPRMENLNLENASVVSNMNMENTSMVSNTNLESTSMASNMNLENTSILSPNTSFAGSVGSISFTEPNNTDIGTDLELNSDISMQSNLDDLNNSINFSEDGNSVARSDNNDTNAVNPDPPVSAPMGMFASQNKRFFNFQGFFPK